VKVQFTPLFIEAHLSLNVQVTVHENYFGCKQDHKKVSLNI